AHCCRNNGNTASQRLENDIRKSISSSGVEVNVCCLVVARNDDRIFLIRGEVHLSLADPFSASILSDGNQQETLLRSHSDASNRGSQRLIVFERILSNSIRDEQNNVDVLRKP